MNAVTLVLELLRRLLDFVKNKKIQHESEKGREDPADAFADHFNGRVQSPDEQPDADETRTESDRQR